MTNSALSLLVLLAWPTFNIALAALAALLRRRSPAAPPGGADARPDHFWIIVPALNEERVVGNTVQAALALTDPAATTHVLVVDDGSDDRTPEVLAQLRHPRLTVLRRDPPDARQGKGEALNHAYRHLDQWCDAHGHDPCRVAVGIIDGDGRGSANLLREVGAALADPRVGAVQARVRIHNRRRLLAVVQDLEFALIAHASQIVRDRLGSVGLGGNGQFTRLSALRSLGPAPWSDCLVEDLELGLRLHLRAVGIRYAAGAHVSQQAVTDMRRLLRQRTRWAQGNLQCVRYLPRISASADISTPTYLEMAWYLLAPWVNALGSLALVGVWAYAAARAALDPQVTVLAGTPAQWSLGAAALLLPGLVWAALHRRNVRDESPHRLLAAGLAYPFFLVLCLGSTWRALGRQVAGRHGWAKTERAAEEPVPA